MATRKGRPIADARNTLVGSVTPTGTVSTFTGVSAPNGHLLCDGSVVSRTTYSALFDILGTSHGEGDGSTTFHLPDYRGRFLRGMDNGAGRDADAGTRTASNTGGNVGDAVGAVQEDAMQRITGGSAPASGSIPYSIGGSGLFQGAFNAGGTLPNRVSTQGGTGGRELDFDSSSSTSPNPAKTSDVETRPVNINVNYIIKA